MRSRRLQATPGKRVGLAGSWTTPNIFKRRKGPTETQERAWRQIAWRFGSESGAHEGSHFRAAIRLARPEAVEQFKQIKPANRPRHVRGPMGAVMCYLLQTGWAPTSAESWSRPPAPDGAEVEWNLPPDHFAESKGGRFV